MTKKGERTIIWQIHSLYVECLKVSDKKGGADRHLADSLITSSESKILETTQRLLPRGLRPPLRWDKEVLSVF